MEHIPTKAHLVELLKKLSPKDLREIFVALSIAPVSNSEAKPVAEVYALDQVAQGADDKFVNSGFRAQRNDRPDYVFAFQDNEDIGPRMLARVARHTGLTPADLKKTYANMPR
jgi:hypothetical protein